MYLLRPQNTVECTRSKNAFRKKIAKKIDFAEGKTIHTAQTLQGIYTEIPSFKEPTRIPEQSTVQPRHHGGARQNPNDGEARRLYACVDFYGSPNDCKPVWQDLLMNCLPNGDYVFDCERAGFEHYLPSDRFDVQTGAFFCWRCAPVKARK